MYKKLLKIFVSNNIRKFIIIIFCISLSLTGFLVSENLIKNVQTLIGNEAKPIFGGDIKIDVDAPLKGNQKTYLTSLENQKKIILSEKNQAYTTIVDVNNNPSIVSLLFLDDNYPLYGEYEVEKTSIAGSGVIVSQNVQDLFVKDEKIEVYGKTYPVEGIIKKFPETGFNFYDDFRKVILKPEEFNILGIEQLGARIDREYLIKVINQDEFEPILNEIKQSPLFEGLRILDYKRGGDRLSDTFSELDIFIKYILIVSFLLTIIIIFLSVEAFYIGNKRVFSILKILGIKNKNVLLFNILLFISIFIISFSLSFFLAEGIFIFVRSFEISKDFYMYFDSIIKTLALGGIILSISVFLPIYKFFSNNPLAGLKENFLQIYSKKEIGIEGGLIVLGSLLIYMLIIGDIKGAFVFTSIAVVSFFLFVYSIKKILHFLFSYGQFLKTKNYALYDSIRNTIKPGNLSLLLFFSFFVSFASLLFISIVSFNFLERLNLDIKSDKNLYVINLKEDDINNIDAKYKDSAYSIILGRILTINGQDVKTHLGENGEGRQFTREFNITDNPLSNVKILNGDTVKTGEVSLDDDFAESLEVDIGDEIEFLVYGIHKKLRIVNIRESQVSGANPFFYFQVYPDDFKDFPKNYFISTFIEAEKIKEFKNDFLAKTGNHISFIDIGEIIKQVKSVSTKIFIIIQVLFLYIFAFCFVSLIVSIVFLIPFKSRKTELYSILGAGEKFLDKNNIFEYFYIQVLSLLISIGIASVGAYYLLSQSNFLSFGWKSYGFSLLILLLMSTFLIGIIHFFIKNLVGKNN